MTQEWLTSGDMGAFLSQRRDNDVKVAIGNRLVPIADIYYDSMADTYIIELADGIDLSDALMDLGEAAPPELWGVAQAAEFLGGSRQQINQLVHDFPHELEPLTKFPGSSGTRVWLAKTWRDFAQSEGPQERLRRWRKQ